MYRPDTIDIDADNKDNIGAFFGANASRYAYKPELRAFIDHLVDSARHSTNRHFVVKGTTVYAAQSKRLDALGYMDADRVLVSIELATV